ncbi:MAG TPA: glycoside hydrolase family 30 beta sandwich domain-containing protein [Candidatus Acidoferrum sp.]|nr:glycoside hydrolase family 30 beta sandwich domain-containing protein [Candidatus Acidoferrum sp.]
MRSATSARLGRRSPQPASTVFARPGYGKTLRYVVSTLVLLGLVLAAAFAAGALAAQNRGGVQFWLTNPDKSALFELQKPSLNFSKEKRNGETRGPVIEIDDHKKFQSIAGFGFALTGGSAQHLAHMDSAKRAALLHELFSLDGNSIGISYLRISIGSSDLNDRAFSYDDLPAGETDPGLAKFSLAPDRAELIPVLKEILAINPKIEILGSPWSAPPWMKTNDNAKGGSLKPEFYQAYANYFVKYIEGMRAEGITISAITVQNEPLNDKNTPSMLMSAEEEAQFIERFLGPAFQSAKIRTKIILYDHNCNQPGYPMSILKDPRAYRYVDGSGFHLYEGKIEAMSEVHDAFPRKNLYFTEFMAVEPTEGARITISKPVVETFMGALQNWSRNVLLWNLAADSKFEPHTDNGGCPICQGAVTIDGNEVTRNLAYYAMAHFSKFVRRGSVRIASTAPDKLPNVAFRAPGGKSVLVVANTAVAAQEFSVKSHGRIFHSELKAGAVGTYAW